MPDSPLNEQEPSDPLNPVTEIRQLFKVGGEHFRQLGELFKIEATEAGQFAGRKAALGVGAAIFGFFFHLLVICGLVGWLPTLLGWPWFIVAFALAGVHLLVLLILVLMLKKKPQEPFFAATKAQLEKDKQCLAQTKKDVKKN